MNKRRDIWVKGWANEGTNEQREEWRKGQQNKEKTEQSNYQKKHESKDKWTNEQMKQHTNEWTNKIWTDKQMNEQTNEYAYKGMNKQTNQLTYNGTKKQIKELNDRSDEWMDVETSLIDPVSPPLKTRADLVYKPIEILFEKLLPPYTSIIFINIWSIFREFHSKYNVGSPNVYCQHLEQNNDLPNSLL